MLFNKNIPWKKGKGDRYRKAKEKKEKKRIGCRCGKALTLSSATFKSDSASSKFHFFECGLFAFQHHVM